MDDWRLITPFIKFKLKNIKFKAVIGDALIYVDLYVHFW